MSRLVKTHQVRQDSPGGEPDGTPPGLVSVEVDVERRKSREIARPGHWGRHSSEAVPRAGRFDRLERRRCRADVACSVLKSLNPGKRTTATNRIQEISPVENQCEQKQGILTEGEG
jgi:hypothetical protein